jgi:hypothetical protein
MTDPRTSQVLALRREGRSVAYIAGATNMRTQAVAEIIGPGTLSPADDTRLQGKRRLLGCTACGNLVGCSCNREAA